MNVINHIPSGHEDAEQAVERLPWALGSADHTVFDRAAYSDPVVYEREQRELFGRAWQFVGHESQVAKPGDFFRSRMGEERVILTRSRDGKLHVLINSCSHRGAEVCAVDSGNAATLTCPYHAWSYNLDGSLNRVPFAEVIGCEIDRAEWGLATAPRVQSYKGLVFASFDPDAPSLEDALGDIRYYLDVMLDRRDGQMVVIGMQRWRHGGNWKLPVESATGDFYHVKFAHASAAHVSPELAASVTGMSDADSAANVAAAGGHAMNVVVQPEGLDEDAYLPVLRRALAHEELVNYFRSIQPEARERLGPERERLTINLGVVFPNLVVLPLSFSLRVCFPEGIDQGETWMWVLGYEDMSPTVRESFVNGYLAGVGPDSLLEPDDMAVWTRIARGTASRQARNRPLFSGLGIGRERSGSGGMPGRWGHPMSEIGMRNYYRSWTTYMRGGEGSEVQ